MAQEIERKFLLLNDQWRKQAKRHDYYRQGYLNDATQCSIRVRIANDNAYLNIKSATLGIQRSEYEYKIPMNDANDMLSQFSLGPIIEKTRYFVDIGKHTWEIDVFEGDNKGLVVAEIELAHEDEIFEKPSWLGQEVSNESRYYNVCLSKHPYKNW